jgi:hypothetical protein
MFGKQKKSYSESDVYSLAMEWREIEESADCGTPAGGMIEWAKVGDNKRKLHKNFGIQHGFIKGKFKGKSEDFDDFIKEVVIKTHNHGLGLNFGKSIYKEHKSLIKKMDEDYFSGIKLGLDQALTEENHYRDYQIELFGPSGLLLPIK